MKPCAAPNCDNVARKTNIYCDAHVKRQQRGQSMTAPIDESKRHKSRMERAIEAALDYANAEEDAEYTAAYNGLRKAMGVTPTEVSAWTREALAKLKADGVRLGRPRKADVVTVLQVFLRTQSTTRAAEALRLSPRTVRRLVAEAGKEQADKKGG